MSTATSALSEKEQDELNALLFGVRRSIRYHNRRRRFFDGFDKFVKVLSVVGGSAAFAAATAHHSRIIMVFTGLVAAFSAVNLVVGPAQAARLHEELARKFAKLERDMKVAKVPNSDQLNGFQAERLLIESEEPPIMRVLDIVCHNELCEAMGYDTCHLYKVGIAQSLFAHFIDLWPSKIDKKANGNAADTKCGSNPSSAKPT
jgi:hypothetical protein